MNKPNIRIAAVVREDEPAIRAAEPAWITTTAAPQEPPHENIRLHHEWTLGKAQEPPWVVAARDCGLSDKTLSVRIIKAACLEHSLAITAALKREYDEAIARAAALAQERDKWHAARDECERQFQAKVAEIVSLNDELDQARSELSNATALMENRLTLAEERCASLTSERDRYYQQMLDSNTKWDKEWEAESEKREIAEDAVERLTAERDKAIAALEAIMRRVPIMGSEGDYRKGQLHALEACSEVARAALSGKEP